jgi:hypothetical protein
VALGFGVAMLVAYGVFVGSLLALPARANGVGEPFGIEAFSTQIEGTQAGSHPESMTTTIVFDHHFDPEYKKLHAGDGELPNGSPQNIEINLPPGLVVDPTATDMRCTEAELEDQNNCPIGSAVGSATVVTEFFENAQATVFNMAPPPGVPGELGINVANLGIVAHVIGKVRPGDHGLSADVFDITQQTAPFLFQVTLYGDPPLARKPFLTLPTSCTGTPLTTTMSATSWQEPKAVPVIAEATLPPVTGCERIFFEPSINVQPDTTAADSPSGLDVDLAVSQEERLGALARSGPRKVIVTLPPGMAASPSGAGGLGVCTLSEIGLDNTEAASCPPSSRIGSVEVFTPLLERPLPGSLYLAQPLCGGDGQSGCSAAASANGELIGLYLVVEGSGLVIKMPGKTSLDPTTGQVTGTFDDIPQVPFSEVKLKLFGGPRAPLVTPLGCGTFTTTTQLTPWSAPFSGPPLTPQDSFAISSGCGGGGFAPELVAGSEDSRAGVFSSFVATLSRKDGDQRLADVQLRTPRGLLGVLKSVTQCPEPQASSGTCRTDSLIGHATVAAGPGPDPLWVSGSVYLTGPYRGAPFGLAIVVPAVAGPFNLGEVVERASIDVDPRTAQVTVTSDPLRTILDGVPLDLRTVSIAIDRQGFLFNPTSCAPASVVGTVAAGNGASAGVSERFQTTDCGALAFKPTFSVSTQAGASKADGASLDVKTTIPAGDSNIAKVDVTLPKRLPSRLTTLQKACIASVFAENPALCPAGSLVGVATASTPLLAHPLSGPAYIVSHGNGAFPDLVVVLQGEGITIELDGQTKIKKGITYSMFDSLPDAPVGSFELKLPESPHSILAANGNLCAGKLNMPTTIVGQNGKQVKQTTRIAVTGCPKAARAKRASRLRAGRGARGRSR